MANRRTHGAILGFFWLLSIAALLWIVLFYDRTSWSHRSGFPYMPFYGAVTWWFFFTIPIIGFTWGFFNDLKSDF